MQTAVDFVARCLSSSAVGALGGVKFKKLTQEEFEALETKDSSTFYLVESGNKIILYLGNSTIGSGVAGGNTIVQTISSMAITGNLEEV